MRAALIPIVLGFFMMVYVAPRIAQSDAINGWWLALLAVVTGGVTMLVGVLLFISTRHPRR